LTVTYATKMSVSSVLAEVPGTVSTRCPPSAASTPQCLARPSSCL
jgi:hypothetical protein